MGASAPPSNGRRRAEMVRPPGVSRREFLSVGVAVGGGLLLGFDLPAPPPSAFEPNAFIRIDRDGRVTLIMHKVEMGQGTYTSMSMLLAEELEVDLGDVRVEHAPPDDARYAEPLFGVQETGGSTSVRGNWEPLRRAGAAARSLLVAAAAAAWNVDPASCHAARGTVLHGPTNRSLGYGALVDKAATLRVPSRVPLKDPKDFKLIGTPAKRVDAPAKVDGTAQFGIDVRLPDMKVATLAACPVFGGRLASVDDARAKAIPGVRQIIRLDDAVAVVADHMWAAKQGTGPVKVVWTREEDIQHDMYRPYYYDRIAAGLDAGGKPVAWTHRVTGSSIMARVTSELFPKNLRVIRAVGLRQLIAGMKGLDTDAVEGAAEPPYEPPHIP